MKYLLILLLTISSVHARTYEDHIRAENRQLTNRIVQLNMQSAPYVRMRTKYQDNPRAYRKLNNRLNDIDTRRNAMIYQLQENNRILERLR